MCVCMFSKLLLIILLISFFCFLAVGIEPIDAYKIIGEELFLTTYGWQDLLVKMTPLIGSIAWRAVAVISYFTGKTPVITEETINTILKTYFYSNAKYTIFRFISWWKYCLLTIVQLTIY